MMSRPISDLFALLLALLPAASLAQPAQAGADEKIPRLERRGAATQLIVDGAPFLVLGGELHNSSSSSLDFMRTIWPELAGFHVNTVLAPVSWELVEPREGVYDFGLVDGLIREARGRGLRLGILWFGSWKNMVSSYAPVWIRADPSRYACAVDASGNRLPILSTFSDAACAADSKALAALMRHVRRVEEGQPRRTVLMVQVQNEMGLDFGTRDCSAAANGQFVRPVPHELMQVLFSAKEAAAPELRRLWEAAGRKREGSWEEVFGRGAQTNEIFMAWNYARYVQRNVAAAKAEYPVPMYVNASVGRRDGAPGTYPSGGPVAYLTEVWKAAAPSVDWLSPDIYYGDFPAWCRKYTEAGNPLFIPEMGADAGEAKNVMAAIARFKAIGCARFALESPFAWKEEFVEALGILSQLEPLILQGQRSGGLAFDTVDGATAARSMAMGRYTFNLAGIRARNVVPENRAGAGNAGPSGGFALAAEAGPDEFFVAGRNIQITFSPRPEAREMAAVASIDEGSFVEGNWVAGRRLNGDEIMLSYQLSEQAGINQTGTGAQFPPDRIAIYRIRLVRYPESAEGEVPPAK